MKLALKHLGRSLRLAFTILGLLNAHHACAEQATDRSLPVVEWLVNYENPPLFVGDGPYAGQGVMDRVLHDILIPRLGGYRHVVLDIRRAAVNWNFEREHRRARLRC